ncbi:hypothetical protein [Mesorhizobium sp. 10J20-29]
MNMTRSALLFALLLLAPGVAFAADVVQTFAAPEVRGVRLDWCKHWGRECGGPAANLFCAEKGFSRAVRFLPDPSLGSRNIATVVYGDGRICEGPACTGFRAITCMKPGAQAPPSNNMLQQSRPPAGAAKDGDAAGVPFAAHPKPKTGSKMTVTVIDRNATRFAYPAVKGVRLDWCRNWGKGCGHSAAELFCLERGFAGARDFQIDRNIGAQGIPTLVFGDGRPCEGKQCSGFRQIICMHDADRAKSQSPKEKAGLGSKSSKNESAEPLGESTLEPSTKPPARIFALPETMTLLPVPRPTNRADPIVVPSPPPMISFAQFRPLSSEAVALDWSLTLKALATYPAGAGLYRCASGDCSIATAADFEIVPTAAHQHVTLNFNITKVPHSGSARWQVSHLPFPPFSNGSARDIEPPGLVESDVVRSVEGSFSFDLRETAHRLPRGTASTILHVRVLPLAAAGFGQVVGQPSNVMRIFYGAELPPQEPFQFYSTLEVPGSRPDLELTKLVFEPYRYVTRWPPKCKTWEEKYGDDDKNILEEIGGFFSGAWNWASKAYQWVKDRVVDVVNTLTLDLIPESVLGFALDTALATMGIPPNIPNLDQLMKEGIDGLAQEVAKTSVSQIPSADLAANVGNLAADITIEAAAGMAEQQLRERLQDELEKRSRQALLAAADEIARQTAQAGKGSLCKPTSFHPKFRITVLNRGDKSLTGVEISASAGPVYRGATWTVDLDPHESMTLVAVGTPILPNGPYSSTLLYPAEREKEDLQRWWNEVLNVKRAKIEVLLPGGLLCMGGDPTSPFCETVRELAHRSLPQMVTEPYSFSIH